MDLVELAEWSSERPYKEDNLEIVAINASYPAETLAHLIKYDTTHGRFDGEVVPHGGSFSCGW